MIDKPIFEILFNFAKIITQNIIKHAIIERIKVNSGTDFNNPKAAPELYVISIKSDSKILETCSIKMQDIIMIND